MIPVNTLRSSTYSLSSATLANATTLRKAWDNTREPRSALEVSVVLAMYIHTKSRVMGRENKPVSEFPAENLELLHLVFSFISVSLSSL